MIYEFYSTKSKQRDGKERQRHSTENILRPRMRSSERSSGNFYKVVYRKGELPERIKWIKTKK